MSEDFLTRRRKQLEQTGRSDLAAQLTRAKDKPPEFCNGIQFSNAYAHILEVIAGFMNTGYRPAPETVISQRQVISQWSDVELFFAVFDNDIKMIARNPAHYVAMIDELKHRGSDLVMRAGLAAQTTKS